MASYSAAARAIVEKLGPYGDLIPDILRNDCSGLGVAMYECYDGLGEDVDLDRNESKVDILGRIIKFVRGKMSAKENAKSELRRITRELHEEMEARFEPNDDIDPISIKTLCATGAFLAYGQILSGGSREESVKQAVARIQLVRLYEFDKLRDSNDAADDDEDEEESVGDVARDPDDQDTNQSDEDQNPDDGAESRRDVGEEEEAGQESDVEDEEESVGEAEQDTSQSDEDQDRDDDEEEEAGQESDVEDEEESVGEAEQDTSQSDEDQDRDDDEAMSQRAEADADGEESRDVDENEEEARESDTEDEGEGAREVARYPVEPDTNQSDEDDNSDDGEALSYEEEVLSPSRVDGRSSDLAYRAGEIVAEAHDLEAKNAEDAIEEMLTDKKMRNYTLTAASNAYGSRGGPTQLMKNLARKANPGDGDIDNTFKETKRMLKRVVDGDDTISPGEVIGAARAFTENDLVVQAAVLASRPRDMNEVRAKVQRFVDQNSS